VTKAVQRLWDNTVKHRKKTRLCETFHENGLTVLQSEKELLHTQQEQGRHLGIISMLLGPFLKLMRNICS